jgi:heme exporter protein A
VRGRRRLFAGLNFRLCGGDLLRVTGANGSGKTSLLRILCGLLSPVCGMVRWDGGDIRSLREEYWRQLLYIGHAHAVKGDLTALENLLVSCTLVGVNVSRDQALEALSRLGLAGYEALPVKILSRGQQRRVALARLFLSEKIPLWILDEPFDALDAVAVDCVRLLIAQHLARGGAVVLTTHQEIRIENPQVQCINLDSWGTKSL